MEIRLLGPLLVDGATGPVAIGSARQRAVLVTLAMHAGAPVPPARLIDAVWQEDPPESARNSLQSHVARLRSVLGDASLIVLDAAGYRLALPPSCVDALRFEQLVRDGAVAAALKLWRGAPLPEFAGEPFAGWAARLSDVYRGALVRQAHEVLSAGRAEEAVAGLHAAVEADPIWEPGALLMARALAGADRRGDAAAALRRHADAVVDALGMDPSPVVKRMQTALLRGEPIDPPPPAPKAVSTPGMPPPGAKAVITPGTPPHVANAAATVGLPPASTAFGTSPLAAPVATTVGPAAGAEMATEFGGPLAAAGAGTTDGPDGAQRPGPGSAAVGGGRDFSGRVPIRFSSFVGRDAEQARLARLLAEPGLVSVVGPGGVGKTRLVAETVRAGTDVAWVDAADVRGRDDFLQAVAVGVGARLGPNDNPLTVIAAGAAEKLIVLDNCEHLLDVAAELVEALLPARIVVTSQERLRVDGERVLALGPLSSAAGVRLFADRAGGAVEDGDAAAVADIVAGLDALPLAIELAATQAAGLGVPQLRERLGDRLDLLTRGRRTGAARHRTLRAVVDWSFGLLEPRERAVLCRLAAFAGGFTLGLAEAVAADLDGVAGSVAVLVDRSLVVRHGPRRFRLLETVRAFAGEQLAASPDAAATYQRHAAAMVAAAEDLDARMHGPDQISAVREIDALLPDLRRARLSKDDDVLVRLAAAMFRYGYHCQQYEVLAWGYDAVPVAAHPRLPIALAAGATHAWGRGDLAVARELGERALRAAPSPAETSGAHEVLGDVALVACDADEAARHYRAMAAAGLASGRAAVRSSGMGAEALVLAWSGRDDEAVRLAGAALEVAVASRNPSALAEAHYALGEVLGDLDPPRALASLATAARLAASVDDRLFAGASETAAAAIAGRHGDPAAALASFREVLALWQRAGNDTLQTNALRNLLVLLARVGADEATALVDAALPVAELYPAEAARLDRARAAVAERLGPDRLAALRRRAALLTPAQVVEEAMAAIDTALRS